MHAGAGGFGIQDLKRAAAGDGEPVLWRKASQPDLLPGRIPLLSGEEHFLEKAGDVRGAGAVLCRKIQAYDKGTGALYSESGKSAQDLWQAFI